MAGMKLREPAIAMRYDFWIIPRHVVQNPKIGSNQEAIRISRNFMRKERNARLA